MGACGSASCSCDIAPCRSCGCGVRQRPSILAARIILWTTYLAVAVVAGLAVWRLVATDAERQTVGWVVAFLFCCLSVPISVYDIVQHLLDYRRPDVQRFYIRIMWMVPIYAMESFGALKFRDINIYLETARETYEAFVLYSFYALLLSYLGGTYGKGLRVERSHVPSAVLREVDRADAAADETDTDEVAAHADVVRLPSAIAAAETALVNDEFMSLVLRRCADKVVERRAAEGESPLPSTPTPTTPALDDGSAVAAKHIFPFCLLRPWRIGTPFLHWTRWGVFQYVILRLICTLLIFILQFTNTYGEGKFEPDRGYVYIIIIMSVSQSWALYCLTLFYLNFKKALGGLNPLGKFATIKLLVFFIFWQAIIVAGAAKLGWIAPTAEWTVDDIGSGIQDFIVCIEMFFFAVAHHFLFSHHEFDADPEGDGSTFLSAAKGMFPSDMVQAVPRILSRRKSDSKAAAMEVLNPVNPAAVRDVRGSPTRRDTDATEPFV